MSTKTKQSTGAKLLKSDDAAGTISVAFAQLNVVDHDGDYTLPGAFEVGQKVKMCQTGHAHGALPAGAGAISGEMELDGGLWAVADMKFFMNTIAGRETYLTVKALQEAEQTQEWSYGYDTLAAGPMEVDGKYVNGLQKQSVYEISPVLRGAGIGTRTLAIKAMKDMSSDTEASAFPCPSCGEVMAVVVLPADATVNEGDAAKSQADAETSDDALADAIVKGRTIEALAQFAQTRVRLLEVL